MPFYRCSIKQNSGGGGGGGIDEIYGRAILENGDYYYPNLSAYNAYFSSPKIINVTIGSHINNAYSMFYHAYLDCPVTVPGTIKDCINMFSFSHFNDHLTLENGINRIDYMFYNAYTFNQPLVVPDSVTTAPCLFFYARAFNSRVILGNNVTNCKSMFQNASSYNQPTIIPINVTSTHSMFYNADSFNSPVVIKAWNNIAVYFMFNNCPNYGQNVIFTDPNLVGVVNNDIWYRGMFLSHNKSVRVNIFAYNPQLFTRTEAGNSLTNTAITWAATTNGYYNALWNIYILNNVQDAYDAFNTVYNQ